MIKSSNPALSGDTFSRLSYSANRADSMTIQGTVYKTFLLLLLALLSAGWTWNKFYHAGGNPSAISTWMMIGVFGGFAVALATVFKKRVVSHYSTAICSFRRFIYWWIIGYAGVSIPWNSHSSCRFNLWNFICYVVCLSKWVDQSDRKF